MATVILHFRPSSLKDGTGRPFIRLIHRRETRQMSIKMQIKASGWDSYSSSVIIPNGINSGRVKYLKSVQQHIHTEIERLMSVIRRLDDYGAPYSVDEILKLYQATRSMSDESHEVGFVAYMRRLIEVLRRCGQMAKVERYTLVLADVAKIKALDLSDKPKLAFYRDLWMLSYYLCGIAFCDLAKLRKDSLNNGVLYYSRSKTRHKIAVKWLPEMAKSAVGVRKLGLPPTVDRTFQQSIVQILTPVFEAEFQENSYGFRPPCHGSLQTKTDTRQALENQRVYM